MEFKSNISETIEKLEKIKTSLGATNGNIPIVPDFSDAILSGLNAQMGKMKFRIFNKGEDAEGNKLGNYHGKKTKLTKKKYSIASDDEFDERDRKTAKRNLNRLVKNSPNDSYTEYEKKRVSKGRQIGYKDLQFGDSLFNSIEAVKTDYAHAVIAITNGDSANVAFYQEKQIGNIRAGLNAITGNAKPAKIFLLSQAEYDGLKDEVNAAIDQIIKNLFQ